MLLVSTLLGELLLFLTVFVLGAMIGLALSWLQGRRPWLPSTLPAACSPADSGWDEAMMGWWVEAPPGLGPTDPGIAGLHWRWAKPDATDLQYLLTTEQVSYPGISIYHFIDGARK